MSHFRIDFVVAGFQKCGTSTLADFLMQHPEVNFCKTKEPVFFTENDYKQKSLNYYRSLYSADHPGRKVEASTAYAFPHNAFFSATELRKHNPSLRLIFLIRNPIDRVRSAIRHSELSLGYDDKTEWLETKLTQAIRNSACGETLKTYMKFFRRQDMLLVRFEDLIEEEALGDICRFLSISEECDMSLRKVNYSPSKGKNPSWFNYYRKYHHLILQIPFSQNIRGLGRKVLSRDRSTEKSSVKKIDLTNEQVCRIKNELKTDSELFEREFGLNYFNLTR